MSEIISSTVFALAVLHTFSVKGFQHLARRFPEGSFLENLLHLLGEVELVFGFWAAVFLGLFAIVSSPADVAKYVDGLSFAEPVFVFAIMAVAATRPIMEVVTQAISVLSRQIPIKSEIGFYIATLTVGPLLGSFITEPAAMTVTALMLKRRFLDAEVSDRFKYLTLGLLLVNVSIGGVLTHFAAPPVVMVARPWNWGMWTMLSSFGWRAVVAVLINASTVTAFLWADIKKLSYVDAPKFRTGCPWWLTVAHFGFLVLLVVAGHYPKLVVGLFLLFLAVVAVTREHQDEIRIQQSLLVGLFLAGLVVLGGLQGWWLSPLIQRLSPSALFFTTTGLTAILDNAALTYLGTRVPDMAESLKYALVAGAVSGGGLTIIANAPNPAGFAILNPSFGAEGISPAKILLAALWPTSIAIICFWVI